ncbi:MAG: hypothetical protein U5M23_13180, partial [Marinagarivorans sp.]|nr:hypothetical protein [Marinagarivorans sp.]
LRIVADVSKKFVPRRAHFVLPPAPHCFQADFPSGRDLLFCHHGVVHFHLLGKCLHDNAVRRRSQARCSGHARIAKLGWQLLVEIDFDACDKALQPLDEGGINKLQAPGVLINILCEGVENHPLEIHCLPCLHVDFPSSSLV